MPQDLEFEIDDDPYRRTPGPILLVAGPGTGKTHQLARRAKHLVQNKNASPDSITVITFTREAAANMRRRIADEEKTDVYISPKDRPGRITTMHSLGLEIIRENTGKLGLPEDFRVVTDSQLRRIVFRDASLLEGSGEKEAKEAELLRQKAVTPEAGCQAARIIERYETILRANKAIDYDDQISLACELLEINPDVLNKFSATCVHLLVDEYQDVNAGQQDLIQLLSKEHPEGLFVVGDDDQSIYSFRGGTPEYIRRFALEYGAEGRTLWLVQSRRCPDTVISTSLDVVRKFDPTRMRKPDPVFPPGKQNGRQVTIHNVASDDQEAEVIVGIIGPICSKKSVLVLIPAKQYADKIKHQLRIKGVPYSHPPNLEDAGFVSLQVVHNWRLNPDDSLSLRLCIELLCNGGSVGIPSDACRDAAKRVVREKQLKEIATLWTDVIDKGLSLWQALERKSKIANTPLAEIYNSLSALLQMKPENVGAFLSAVASGFRPWTSIESLMREVDVWAQELRAHGQLQEGGVKITTLQAAKGLEADVVCVIGLNEGILPRKGASAQAIEESARLTYVSMTRAREELHLFHARKRDGSVTYLPRSYQLKRSRFLDAMGRASIETRYHPAPSKMGARLL
jgi:DNA helicase-2/ATP-dependent DNA helicase PcrA